MCSAGSDRRYPSSRCWSATRNGSQRTGKVISGFHCRIHLPLRRYSTSRCIRFLGVVLSSGASWHQKADRCSPPTPSTSLPRGWRPNPFRDGGERAEARAVRGGHPVRGGHRAGHRVGPERQAAMAAQAASRTLAEVGRRRRKVTTADVSLPGKGWAACTERAHGSVTAAA
jgi:hypothetical protein